MGGITSEALGSASRRPGQCLLKASHLVVLVLSFLSFFHVKQDPFFPRQLLAQMYTFRDKNY